MKQWPARFFGYGFNVLSFLLFFSLQVFEGNVENIKNTMELPIIAPSIKIKHRWQETLPTNQLDDVVATIYKIITFF